MSLKKELGIFTVLQFLFFLVSLLTKSMLLILLMTVLQLLMQMYFLYKKSDTIIQLPIIFLVISYIFHISRLLIEVIFNYKDNIQPQYLSWFSFNDVKYSVLFYMVCTFFYCLGIVIYAFYDKKPHKKIKENKYLFCSKNMFMLIAIVLLVIGIIPRMMIDINSLIMRINGNYLSVYSLDLSGKGGLASLVYTAILMIVYAVEDRKKANIIIFISFFWEIIVMFSGMRFDAISFIIALLYIYFTKEKKIMIKDLIKYFILLFFILVLINTIRNLRTDAFSISIFIKTFIEQILKNPIIEMFAEMGSSLLSVILPYKFVPKNVSYGYGLTYIKTILSLIPKIGNIMDLKEVQYMTLMPFNWAVGGSWIGEIYYNFGWIGAIFCGIIGYIVCSIDILIKRVKNNYFACLFCFPFMTSIIKFVRSYFYLFRLCFIHIIVILFIWLVMTYLVNNERTIKIIARLKRQ